MSISPEDLQDYEIPKRRKKMAEMKTLRISLLKKRDGKTLDVLEANLIKKYFADREILFITKEEYAKMVLQEPEKLVGKGTVSIYPSTKVPGVVIINIHNYGE